MLLGQSRVFYAMSKDGLLPKIFASVHPTYRTPWLSNLLFMVCAGVAGGLLPLSLLGHITSFGTLLAFVVVCIGVLVLRSTDPGRRRAFRTPWVPFVPVAGIVVCGGLMYSLPANTLWLALAWLLIGLVIFFGYSRNHSRLTGGRA
jgi:APA family basic amino acid/polyamine antiporter